MPNLLTRLQTALIERRIVATRVLLAVSGGPDSVALLRGMLALRETLQLELCVAHLDHQLRPESAEDAQWTAQLAARFGLPFHMESAPVEQTARETGRGTEETARDLRYAFLQRTALAEHCPWIALGHTADDQAETVLHHILRGTGLAGLAGMPAVRALSAECRLVRPLLEVSRQQALDYLGELKQEFRTDATNASASYTRNRIRRDLLPQLREQFNPRVDEALVRLSRQVEEAQQALVEVAALFLDDAQLEAGSCVCRLDCSVLRRLPRHLVRECGKLLWKRAGWPLQAMTFAHWDELADFVLSDSGDAPPARHFPGKVEAERVGNLLRLQRLPLSPPEAPSS